MVLIKIENECHNDNYEYLIEFFIKEKKYKFPLEWIIFGSKTSTDIDILILIPYNIVEIIGKSVSIYLSAIQILDKILTPYISLMSKISDSYLFYNDLPKPINTTFGCLGKDSLRWTFKGGEDETNNSIMNTYHFHPQMFASCPITKKLERNIQEKILRMLRMVVGCLCSSDFDNCTNSDKVSYLSDQLEFCLNLLIDHEIKEIASDRRVLGIKEMINLLLTVPNVNRFVIKVFKEIGETEILEECNKLTSIAGKKQNPKGVYRLKQQMVFAIQDRNKIKVRELIDEYMTNYHIIIGVIQKITNLIENLIHRDNSNNYNDETVEDIKNLSKYIPEIENGIIKLGTIASFVVKIKLCGFAVDFLKHIDWTIVDVGKRDPIDKMKKIAFQIGQGYSLYEGIELYDKESIGHYFPGLKPFLFRQPYNHNDLAQLTQIVGNFMSKINNSIDYQATETIKY